jgi:hypothetical protein
MFQESISHLRALGETWGESLALSWLGDVALLEKDHERSRQLHEQAIAVAREQGDPWLLFAPLMSGGNAALIVGDADKAEALCFEAIRLLRQIDDRWSLAWALNGLGTLRFNSANGSRRASILRSVLHAHAISGTPAH